MSADPFPNLPLLRKTWEKINEIPSARELSIQHPMLSWDEIMDAHGIDAIWHQGVWGQTTSCGTFACFAGWACELNGDHIDASGAVWLDGASFCSADAHAQEILGLTEDEADALFNASNTRRDIRRRLGQVFERVGERFE